MNSDGTAPVAPYEIFVSSKGSIILNFSWAKLLVSLGSLLIAVLTGYFLLFKIVYGNFDSRVQDNTSKIEDNLKEQGRFDAFLKDTLPKVSENIDASVKQYQDLNNKVEKISYQFGAKIDGLEISISELRLSNATLIKSNQEILSANNNLKEQLEDLVSDIRYIKSKLPVRKGMLGETVVGAAQDIGVFEKKPRRPVSMGVARLGGPMAISQIFGFPDEWKRSNVLSYADTSSVYDVYTTILPNQHGVFPIHAWDVSRLIGRAEEAK